MNTNNLSLSPLIDFLKIKSVSMEPKYISEMAKARAYLLKLFNDMDFKSKILKGKKHDFVFAQRFFSKNVPTVLIYGHYDVMPEDPIDEWKTDPFNPTVKKGYIYARGASDDKGQIMAHILAVKSLLEKNIDFPLNIKFIIEGEEEIGSVSIDNLILKYKDLLNCDYLMVSDSEFINRSRPAIDIGLRGLSYLDVSIEIGKKDLHSGQFGGISENPAILLARVISALKDKNNRVSIPNFYKDVATPSKQEIDDFNKVPVSKSSLMEEGNLYLIGGGEAKFSLNERRWSRPTLDINGLSSGYQGEGAKTIIPRKASAKISMRLVPNQDPIKITAAFSKFVRTLVPKQVKLTITELSSSYPYKAPTDNPAYVLIKKALKHAFGKEATFSGVGGSIGFVPVVSKALNVPAIMVGLGLPDDNIHGPNEKLLISNFLGGIKAFVYFYDQLSKLNNNE